MDEIKRKFFRVCYSRGVVDKKTATNILEKLCNNTNVPKIETLIDEINKKITVLDQSLTLQKYSLTREEYVVFAITHEFLDSNEHPTLSDEECRYFGKLIETMANADKYSILWHQALALGNRPGTKVVPTERKQKILERWTQQGYFHDHDDYITFGPRMLVEFGMFLRKNYSEQIKLCSLCNNLTLWDIECTNCPEKYHIECLRSYLRLRSNCPKCKKPWETPLS